MKIYYLKDTTFSNSLSLNVSYLSDNLHFDFDIVPFDYTSNINFVDYENNYLLLTVISSNEFIQSVKFLMKHKFKNIKTIIGGQYVNFILHPEKLLTLYDYVIVGKGENALLNIITKKLPKSVYYDKDFDIIPKHYITNPVILKNLTSVLLTIKGDVCSYNKCEFCDQVKKTSTKQFYTLDENINLIQYYRNNSNIQLFIFYDNIMQVSDLKYLLQTLPEGRKISIVIYGMRVSDSYRDLTKYLRPDIQLFIIWGHEFYDNEILSYFNKGITIEQILDSIIWCEENKIPYLGNLIKGLPLVQNKHIRNHLSFYKHYWDKKIIPSNKFNEFMLSDSTRIINKLDVFKIKLKNRLRINNFWKGWELPENFAKLETIYYDFDMYDEDEKKYVDREFTYSKYDKLFKMYDFILKQNNIKFSLGNQIRKFSESYNFDVYIQFKDNNFYVHGVKI